MLAMQEASLLTSSRGSAEEEAAEIQGSAANDTAAALIASLLTSVIEAPVELFRHRMQVWAYSACFESISTQGQQLEMQESANVLEKI